MNKLVLVCMIAILGTATSVADTLVYHVTGYTLTADGTLKFNGLLFDDQGKVISTLNQDKVDALVKHPTDSLNLVDGKGKYLLPGLIDAHGHVESYGKALSTVDLTGTKSAQDAAQRVSAFLKDNPDQDWIMGWGWNQVLWKGKQFPRAETLDNVAPGKAIALRRVDGHALWVNSEAMKRAGISRDTMAPSGGEIIRDENGNPTGVLVDNAMDIVNHTIPKLTMDQEIMYLEKSMKALSALGLTSVHDAGIPPSTLKAYKTIGKKGDLNVRIYAMLAVEAPGYHELINKGPEPSLFDDRLSVRSIKIVLDGALGSRGAALDAPYSDRPETSGLLLHTPAETEQLTREAMEHGFQVNTHAIGDRGNRILLDIFSKFPQYRNLRNRNEHSQIVHIEDIPRFKKLGVIPSMQPTHATSDKNMAKDRLGEKRLAGAYAWRKFLKQGSRIAGGSDFPVEPANPFFGLHAAVTRQDRDNQPPGGWRPEEKMTREEALRAFTLDAAYAGHQENILGSLEAGKWADFILVDKDYFKVPEQDIWKIKVLQTWQAGKKIFDSTAIAKD